MDINNIKFVPINKGMVEARADVEFNEFSLLGFKVIRKADGVGNYYVTPPSYKAEEGWRPIFRTSEANWGIIQEQIISEFLDWQSTR